MNIDKRYVELLADTVPRKNNKWISRMAVAGFLILFLSMFLFSKSLYLPAGDNEQVKTAQRSMNIAVVIGAAGVLVMGGSFILKNKERKRNRLAFITYYEQNHDLPPWPEMEKPGSNPKNQVIV